MNDLLVNEDINIENMIYEVRGKQVMLDADLAKLYKTTTGNLNRAKNRNIDRFPEDFCFQLSKEEILNLKCQNGISKFDERTINRNLPYVYTEQGVAMLSSVLKTEIACVVSIKIIRAFVRLRKFVNNSDDIIKKLNNVMNLTIKNTNDIKLLECAFDKFKDKEKSNLIYFNGQIYDAYSKLVDIMNDAHDELIIVDAYADKSVLDMISNIKCNVILICKKKSLLKELDILKYYEQYDNLKIIYSDDFHDRYLLLDRNILYHCGTSINHAGSKTFSINKIEDDFVKVNFINNILKYLHTN